MQCVDTMSTVSLQIIIQRKAVGGKNSELVNITSSSTMDIHARIQEFSSGGGGGVGGRSV